MNKLKNNSEQGIEISSSNFEKSEIIIQDKESVLRSLESIDRGILKYTSKDISKLSTQDKIKIFESFGEQSESSGLSKVISFYKSKFEEGKEPKDTDEVLLKLISIINNYKITDLKLDSVMDGLLARGTSQRGLDFKKNLDVSLGGATEMNNEVWRSTKDFLDGYMDKLKNAPVGVKGLMIGGSAIATLIGYFVLTAKKEGTDESPFLSKALKYGLMAFGGFAAGNLLSDLNKREMPDDYGNLNKLVKAKDYAAFFLNREPRENESSDAAGFIETLYNPQVYNLEFSEIIHSVKSNKPGSSEWINMIDGKGVDIETTHGGIEMFINRYDPANNGRESIYKNPDVKDSLKQEMKALWKKVMVNKRVGNELTYRDVTMRFLALDSEFSFINNRIEGNERYAAEEKYNEKQNKYKELERIAGLDFATGWVKKTFNSPELTKFLENMPFHDEVSSVWPDFMSLYHREQGEIGDLFVNIDEIGSEQEFADYKEMTTSQSIAVLKKRVSFKVGIKLKKGDIISMRQTFANTQENYVEPYESSIAVPSRETFFEDFELKSLETGEVLDASSKELSFRTLDPNKKTTKPEMIILPREVDIKPKKSVDMSDYVLYGSVIKFS